MDAIGHGVFPTWKFGIQVCPESRQDEFEFDILDATKIWPEELLPVRYIGELQLNKNVDEYFPQVEQAAFCTAHVVPGIGFSDDPLLQVRNFSYFDTQLSRLGVNFQQIPVNRPVCPVMNHHRDGALQHRINPSKINYWPNRHSVAPPAKEGAYVDYPEKIVAMKQRLHSKKFKEHFSQAQLFWNSMAPHEKAHIINALSFELDHCDEAIVYNRMVERLCDIDLSLAQAVAEKVGAPTPKSAGRPNHGRTAKGLSQLDFTPEALGFTPTIATRQVGILIADGFNYSEYETVKAALTAAGAMVFTIGPRRQPVIPSSGGKGVSPEHHFEAFRSTAFDTLYIPGGEHVATLRKMGRVVHWVREAFGHLKAIGATGEGVDLVRDACGVQGMVFSTTADVVDCYGVVTAAGVGNGPSSIKEGLKMVKGAKNFLDAYAYNIAQHKNYQREMDGLATMVAF
jgi:catalase